MKNSRHKKRIRAQTTRNPKIDKFAQGLRREWARLDLPVGKATVIVAVSGGADSVALFLALDELIRSNKLAIQMVLAHLNHKLRGASGDADARWVSSLAGKLGYAAKIKAVNVRKNATKNKDNLEQAARRARYEFLEKVARTSKAGLVLTAHTLDDQAETVLLNLLRGSGAAGLSGIDPLRAIRNRSEILLARPLLTWARRADTEGYCVQQGIDFRLDQMNSDEKFARVRMRNLLLPLMKGFNPRFVESVARTAEILREDNLALEAAAAHLLELSVNGAGKQRNPALRIDLLRSTPPALRRRALRLWIASCRGDLRRLEYVHIVALEKLLFNTRSGRVVELPGGGNIVRKQGLFVYQGPRAKRSS